MMLKQTKIVASISDLRCEVDFIRDLFNAGMNVVRMNTAHASREGFEKLINNVRTVSNRIGILMDTKGPEVRTTASAEGPIDFKTGEKVRIVGNPEQETTHECIAVTYPGFVHDLSVGADVLMDDGELALKVIDKNEDTLFCEVRNDATLGSRKSVNVPGVRINLPSLTEKDRNNILYAIEKDIDFIAHSFVRNRQDVLDIREILDAHHSDIKIIAKIENPEGVENIDAIIAAADGIMVARGDLGVEIPAEEVPVVQKELIDKCRIAGKPVITATQMLDSMKKFPRPTRAEVSDVATAVLQGTDCVMLSAESASGDYPIEATSMQGKISRTMEKYLNYELLAREAYDTSEKNNNDAIANSVANTALLIGAKLIVCFSETGATGKRISKARPICPILSFSNKREVCLEGALYWGIHPVLIPYIPQFIEEMEALALVKAHELQIPAGTPIIITGGTPTGVSKTNFMKIVNVNEIKDI